MSYSDTTRRTFLRRTAYVGGALIAGCGDVQVNIGLPENDIKIGLLYSQTGNMSLSESSLRDASLLAVEEINAAGGLLDRKIEILAEDPRSRTDLYAKYASKMIKKDKVAAIFGCWTSASRKRVLSAVEAEKNLLFYPLQYEGNESSPNVIYTGATVSQQILPALDWLMSKAGGNKKRFFLIGSDYIYTQTVNYLVKKYLASKNAEVVGEIDSSLDEIDFSVPVAEIVKSQPDIIFSTINGNSNIAFYQEWAKTKIPTEQVPILATSIGESELQQMPVTHVRGHLAAWSYFQSLNTLTNLPFINKFKTEFGGDSVVTDPIVSAYSQIMLWRLAVEKAKSLQADQVLKAFRSGVEYAAAPGFPIKIDPKTQHAYRYCLIGRVRKDRQFDIVYQTPQAIAPDPYPAFAFPGWSCDWTGPGLTRGAEVKILSQ